MKILFKVFLLFTFLLSTIFVKAQCVQRLSVSSVIALGTDSLQVNLHRTATCEECMEPLNISWNGGNTIIVDDAIVKVVAGLSSYSFIVGDTTDCTMINIASFTISSLGEININSGNCSGYTNLKATGTSLGSPLEGPYLPSEVVTFEYLHEFDPNLTACQWMQGIVPDLNTGWLRESLETINVSPGTTWKFYLDGEVQYNEDSYFLSTYIDSFGILRIADIDNPNYSSDNHLLQGDLLPMGWFYYSPGGSSICINDGHPNTGWGFPQGCNSLTMFSFEFDIQVNDTLDIFDCQEEQFTALDLRMFAFADGETGCWGDTKCEGSAPFHIPCELEAPEMPSLTKHYDFHVGQEVEFDVEDPDYIIDSWNFKLDSTELLSSTSTVRFNDYFTIISETDQKLVFRTKNPLSESELALIFHFNVVKRSNPAYIFTSEITIDICERYTTVIDDIYKCGGEEIILNLEDYSLKPNTQISYVIEGVEYNSELINISELDDNTIVTYIFSDDTDCINKGSFLVKEVSNDISLSYEEFVCYGESTDFTVQSSNDSLLFKLYDCDNNLIDSGTSFLLGGGCYFLQYSIGDCEQEEAIEIVEDLAYPIVDPIETFLCKGDHYLWKPNFEQGFYIRFDDIEEENGQFEFAEEGVYSYDYSLREDFKCAGSSSFIIKHFDEMKLDNSLVISSESTAATGEINVEITGGKLPYSYLWSDGATTKDRNHILAGNYVLYVTDDNNCKFEISFEVQSVTGSMDVEVIVPKFWPNPVHTSLWIDNLDAFLLGNVSISNIAGQVLINGKIEHQRENINLNTLSQGVYFIELKKENRTWRKRFVKQ